MADLIAKLATDCYVIWSTTVDAPISSTMTLEELKEHISEEHGREGVRRLPDRLARADATGTSSIHGCTLGALVACNRAGPREKKLTLQQIIKRYAPPKRSTGR